MEEPIDIPGELVHTSDHPMYHRLAGEDHTQYEALVEWCRIPAASRNLANFTRRTGYPPKVARKMMAEWHWEARANAFDHDSLQLRPDPRSMDEEAALAGQMAASVFLLDLGKRVLDTKNIALISTATALKLVEKGVEIQRRAMGQADITIAFDVEDMSRVQRLIGEVVGEEIEDAEIVPDAAIEAPDEDAPEVPM